ncbi:unnamed protein product [Owenia fusiformis]|uniref:Uncharacterized protein n=1 Tax=Owenia fusiformis TaxID=6347 RepID=A0A8J1XJ13_OWEFU|nr:unnamed protein product [Owenia fusiformis]
MFRFVANASLILGLMHFLFVCPQYQRHSYQIKDKAKRETTRHGAELNILENDSEERKTLFSRDTKSNVYFPASREKREIQNEACESVDIDFNCNDTKRSCRERCGDKVTLENATSFVCHCDELCQHYGDCCKDYGQQCRGCNATERGVDTNQTFFDFATDDERCAPLSVHNSQRSKYQCTRVQRAGRVFLKASCHTDFKGSALEKKCFGDGETFSNIPCYDVIKRTHYKNKYCAECDYVKAVKFWRPKIECLYGEHFNKLKVGSLNIPRIMELIEDSGDIGSGCRYEYLEPLLDTYDRENIRGSLRPCFSTISECGFCKDSRLEALCHTHGLDPIQEVNYFHNKHCWKCNPQLHYVSNSQLYPDLCRMVDSSDGRGFLPEDLLLVSFQILMDVKGDTINVRTVPNEQHTRIAEVELTCSDDLVQCRLKRCLGNLKLDGDQCIIRDNVVKVAISCRMLTWPNSNFISAYINSQILFELFPPLRVVSDDTTIKTDGNWINKTFKFDVLFQVKPNVSEIINKTMANSIGQLEEKLNNFLLSNNMSNHAVLGGIEYNVVSVPERADSTVAQNRSGTKSAHNSADTTTGTFILRMLMWFLIFRIIIHVRMNMT